MKNEMNPVVADHERMSAEATKAYKMNFVEEFHRSARTFRILADSLARHAEGFEDATMEAARCIGEQPSGTGQPLAEVSARIARATTEAYAVLSALKHAPRAGVPRGGQAAAARACSSLNHPRSRGGGTALKHAPRTGVPRRGQAVAARSCLSLNHPRSRGGGTALDDLVRHKESLVPQGQLEQLNAVFSESHRIRAQAKNDSRS